MATAVSGEEGWVMGELVKSHSRKLRTMRKVARLKTSKGLLKPVK